jgi:hypothetical protein
MVGSVTSSPATQDIARERGSLIHVSFDGTLTPRTKASTKSLRSHAIKCWGSDIVEKSEDAKNIASAREALKGAELRDGSITAVFERTGKGKVTNSHQTHTEEETR